MKRIQHTLHFHKVGDNAEICEQILDESDRLMVRSQENLIIIRKIVESNRKIIEQSREIIKRAKEKR